jgi:hypothetical protein
MAVGNGGKERKRKRKRGVKPYTVGNFKFLPVRKGKTKKTKNKIMRC